MGKEGDVGEKVRDLARGAAQRGAAAVSLNPGPVTYWLKTNSSTFVSWTGNEVVVNIKES